MFNVEDRFVFMFLRFLYISLYLHLSRELIEMSCCVSDLIHFMSFISTINVVCLVCPICTSTGSNLNQVQKSQCTLIALLFFFCNKFRPKGLCISND